MLLENEERSKCAMQQQKRLFTFFNFILIILILIGSEPKVKAKDKVAKLFIWNVI